MLQNDSTLVIPNGSSFVVTSNVDGHFAEASFPPEEIAQIHGRY
jgi:hypothetical protein